MIGAELDVGCWGAGPLMLVTSSSLSIELVAIDL